MRLDQFAQQAFHMTAHAAFDAAQGCQVVAGDRGVLTVTGEPVELRSDHLYQR
jgi:hypothetical protein